MNGLPLRYPFPAGEFGTPPPVLDWARSERPVCPVLLPSGDKVWMLTRRDDIAMVLTDSRFSRDLVRPGAPRMAGEDFTSVPGGIFNLDPPDHTVVRQVLYPFYTRRGVERHRPLIRRLAEELLDDLVNGPNPTDLLDAYAAPLPLRVSSKILKIPLKHRQPYLDFFHTQTSFTATPAEIAAATAAIGQFTRQVVATRRDDPDRDDPIGALITACDNGHISEEQLHGTVDYLFVTASEPLVAPMLSGPFTLLRNPRQLKECLKQPGLWPKAVEEVLRYHHNGVLGLPRIATEDVILHGQLIAKGDGVCLPMLGATWDPQYYKNPSRFNIHRSTDASAGFGAGPHYCLGAALTRLFLHTAYATLFQRLPNLTLAVADEEVPWEANVMFTRPASLPVAWS